MKKKLLLAVAVSCSLPVLADNAPDLPGDEGELPMVLSATRLHQAIVDAPASISIIDRQMIDQSGVRELPELLRLVPGMVVGYDTGWNAFVSYHGTSADNARRMQVLVDGRSIYQPSLAYVDWIGVPLELADIERIEVIRGPNAAAYGANSFLGVVNIITRHPADLPAATATSRSGTDGIRDNFVRFSNSSDHSGWQLSASTRKDDGFTKLLNKDRTVKGDYIDNKDVKTLYGKFESELSPNTQLSVRAGYSTLLGEESQDSKVVSFLEPPTSEMTKQYAGLSLEHNEGAHQLKLDANYSEFNQYEKLRVSVEPLGFLPELRQLFVADRFYTNHVFVPKLGKILAGGFISSGNATTDALAQSVIKRIYADFGLAAKQNFVSFTEDYESRVEAEVQDTWTLTPTLRMVMGTGIQTSRSDSRFYFNGEVDHSIWRVFAHGEWQFLPDWRLNIGVMDEHDDNAGQLLSPRLALNWRFAPTQSLRIVTSTAYRTPDLLESKAQWQYSGVAENPAMSKYNGDFFYLGSVAPNCVKSSSYGGSVICWSKAQSEKIVSHEIGYFGELPKWHLQTDIRAFHDNLRLSEHNLEIDDFVIAPLVRHQQRGVEISTQWRPVPGWRFLANYAYDDITEYDDNATFVPVHSGNLAVWYDASSGIQASATYVFYNDLFYNSSEGYGLYFDRLDTRVAKRWSVTRRNDLQLAAVTQLRLHQRDTPELRKTNGASIEKTWLELSYSFE